MYDFQMQCHINITTSIHFIILLHQFLNFFFLVSLIVFFLRAWAKLFETKDIVNYLDVIFSNLPYSIILHTSILPKECIKELLHCT